ncbi:hypothetical protein [Maricaulis sp.]|uniref:hypothetical protein n=1 Tax=Maricaulis sp. TaxID=1486257 RepID=UPI00329762D5
MNLGPMITLHAARLVAPHGTAASDRKPTWIQPVSVREAPDSLWQIADQHGIAIMALGWHTSAVTAHCALKMALFSGASAGAPA